MEAEYDMLTYAAIEQTALDALENSAEFQDWCMENFGRKPLLQNDIDPITPPCEEDCPLVAVMAVGGAQGQDHSTFIRGMLVRCAISEGRVSEKRDADGRVVRREHLGTKLISDMLECYVYPALRDAFNALNYPLSTAEEDIELPNMNLFQIKAAISIVLDLSIGENRPYLG